MGHIMVEHDHGHEHGILDGAPPCTAPAPPAPIQTRVLVVTGPVGSGKTTLINCLLQLRKQDDRWAVLVNDFGRAEIPDPSEEDAAGLSVQTLAGCACCTAGPVVRTMFVRLFRRFKPSNAIIELSTLGTPDELTGLLAADFPKHASIGCTVAMVPVDMHEKLWTESQKYRPQLEQADVLVLVGGEAAQVSEISAWASGCPQPKPVFELPAHADNSTELSLPDELLERLLH